MRSLSGIRWLRNRSGRSAVGAAILLLAVTACSGQAAATTQRLTSTPLLVTATPVSSPVAVSPTPRISATATTASASPSPRPTPATVATAAPTTPAQAQTAAEVAAGKAAFLSHCSSCHGPEAAGGIKLGDVTSADLRWNHLGPVFHDDPSLVRRAILTGKGPDGKDLNPVMPHWQGQLSDADVNAIIAYLESTKSDQ